MTPSPPSKQACKGLNRHGEPCGGGVAAGKDWCFAHDPERILEAAAARQKGGKARNKPAPAPLMDLSTPELQRRAIEQAIDRVRAGDESLNIGRFVVYAVSLARPIIEQELIMARIEALEQRLGETQ